MSGEQQSSETSANILLGELKGGFSGLRDGQNRISGEIKDLHGRIDTCQRVHDDRIAALKTAQASLSTGQAVSKVKLGFIVTGVAALVSLVIGVIVRMAPGWFERG